MPGGLQAKKSPACLGYGRAGPVDHPAAQLLRRWLWL
jgi:hypothetical protein